MKTDIARVSTERMTNIVIGRDAKKTETELEEPGPGRVQDPEAGTGLPGPDLRPGTNALLDQNQGSKFQRTQRKAIEAKAGNAHDQGLKKINRGPGQGHVPRPRNQKSGDPSPKVQKDRNLPRRKSQRKERHLWKMMMLQRK